MFRNDLFDGFTRTEPFEDAFHSDPGAPYHGLSHHDVAFGFDEIHRGSLAIRVRDSSAICRLAHGDPSPILGCWGPPKKEPAVMDAPGLAKVSPPACAEIAILASYSALCGPRRLESV